MTVSPGATNTIPSRVELFADLRAPDASRLERLVAAALAGAEQAAGETACRAEIAPRWRYEPVPMSAGPAGAIRRAVQQLGLQPLEIASGAGHDATIMSMAGVPTAMLFVRSDAGGVSHAPEESTGADAVEYCTLALERALRELCAA
jgi:acetylornithine deacetylase/succinyl-diaminopimelate desuccinylase-like protein